MGAFLHALHVFWDHLAAVHWQLLALALGLHLAKLFFRSIAWRAILRAAYPESRLPLRSVFGAYLAAIADAASSRMRVLRLEPLPNSINAVGDGNSRAMLLACWRRIAIARCASCSAIGTGGTFWQSQDASQCGPEFGTRYLSTAQVIPLAPAGPSKGPAGE